tara:strand:+ start:113 stop:463 length:351 start_codon:yes stop_codon:yes gene_type:complete
MILCFDLDNVICRTKNVEYKNAKPILKTIQAINKAYNFKFKILIFTGRFYGKCNGNLKKILKMDNGLTKKQLKKWGVKYHSLMFGKPVFDVYIDDKNFEFKQNWHKKFNKQILKKI